MKRVFWVGVPAVFTFIVIYLFYIAKGESPITHIIELKFTAETLGFPMAAPLLAGFSVDEVLHGLVVHMESQLLSDGWCVVVIILTAVLSVLLVITITRYIPNRQYKLFVLVFYGTGILFFGTAYWRQLDISMDPRHFRIIGILITPGVVYLVATLKSRYQFVFAIVIAALAYNSFAYLVRGYEVNHMLPRGATGIAQPNIDQSSLNMLMGLDNHNRNLTFVLIGDDIGLDLPHNRIIPLQPIPDDLKINKADYTYQGHGGPLYIILPLRYTGVKEKMILSCFPGYRNFEKSAISSYFVMFVAK